MTENIDLNASLKEHFAIKNYEISLVKKEVERMMDFAETAENPIVADNLKDELYSDYGIYNEGEIYGYWWKKVN